MGNRPKRHLPPEERLRAMLKSSSTIRETKQFKDQARDVFSLGGAVGLVHWIDARFELELIQDPQHDQGCRGNEPPCQFVD